MATSRSIQSILSQIIFDQRIAYLCQFGLQAMVRPQLQAVIVFLMSEEAIEMDMGANLLSVILVQKTSSITMATPYLLDLPKLFLSMPSLMEALFKPG